MEIPIARSTRVALLFVIVGAGTAVSTRAEDHLFKGDVLGVRAQPRGSLIAVWTQIDPKKYEPIVLVDTKQTKISINGPADASLLRTGVAIRLTSQIDDQGQVTQPVKQLELVTLSKENPQSLTPLKQKGGTFLIIGKVGATNLDKHWIRVSVPQNDWKVRELRVPLDEQFEIRLSDYADLSVVGPGAAIEVKGNWWTEEFTRNGFHVRQTDLGKIAAKEISVRLAAPARHPDPRQGPQRWKSRGTFQERVINDILGPTPQRR